MSTGTYVEPTGAAGAPTLTVVVCAYTLDRWDDLCDALHSIAVQHHRPEETILVVDHCPELYRRASGELREVRVLRNTERRGLSGARNTGVAAATGDVVAFLDDDAVAHRDWAERLLAPYADPSVAGVGGLVTPWWRTARPVWFPPEFDWVVGCSYRGLPLTATPVRNFIGANMSFRKAELQAAGAFRADLGRVGTRPTGCEETELCLRIAAGHSGAVLLYEPAAAVRHRVPAARARWPYFRARCFAEGRSKALVALHRGAAAALASERTYLRSTIPRAFARGLSAGAGRRPAGHRAPGPPDPLRTLPALCAGVCATVAGYATGRVAAVLGAVPGLPGGRGRGP